VVIVSGGQLEVGHPEGRHGCEQCPHGVKWREVSLAHDQILCQVRKWNQVCLICE